MDASWVNPLISAASGLAGAVIGAGATLKASKRAEEGHRQSEHTEALAGYYAAVNQLATAYEVFLATKPVGDHLLSRVRHGIRLSAIWNPYVTRLFNVQDALWVASGRIRAIASREELDAINEIEGVIGQREIGDPLPEEWSSAVQRLRVLIERLPTHR